MLLTEAATGDVLWSLNFLRKSVLKNFAKFTGNLFFNKVTSQACNFIKKDTSTQVFSCEFCEIFKKTFFTEHLQSTASIWINSEKIFIIKRSQKIFKISHKRSIDIHNQIMKNKYYLNRNSKQNSFYSILFLRQLYSTLNIHSEKKSWDSVFWNESWIKNQKQSPRDALWKRCSKKLCEIDRKTPVMESFLIKL